MPLFNVGDKVECTYPQTGYPPHITIPIVGDIYTVRESILLSGCGQTGWIRLVEIVNPQHPYSGSVGLIEPVWMDTTFKAAGAQSPHAYTMAAIKMLSTKFPPPPMPATPTPSQKSPPYLGPAIHDFAAINKIMKSGRYNV